MASLIPSSSSGWSQPWRRARSSLRSLRGLSLVRDMVAGLPHDGSVDVSARVMQEIRGSARPARDSCRRLNAGALALGEFCRWPALLRRRPMLMIAASLAILLQTSQLERGAEAGRPASPERYRRTERIASYPGPGRWPDDLKRA